ncbi:MAG: hypothetical protein ABH956_02770 [Candidatus Nealsonbacteria bacterium]
MKNYLIKFFLGALILVPVMVGPVFVDAQYYDSYDYGYDYGGYDYGGYDSYDYGYSGYSGYDSYDYGGFYDNYGTYDNYDYGSYDSYDNYDYGGFYDNYGTYDNYDYGYTNDYNAYDNYDYGDFYDNYGTYDNYDYGYTNDYNTYDNYDYGYDNYNTYDNYDYGYTNDYNTYDNYDYGYTNDYNAYDNYDYGYTNDYNAYDNYDYGYTNDYNAYDNYDYGYDDYGYNDYGYNNDMQEYCQNCEYPFNQPMPAPMPMPMPAPMPVSAPRVIIGTPPVVPAPPVIIPAPPVIIPTPPSVIPAPVVVIVQEKCFECMPNPPQPQNYLSCYNNDVYWFNTLGKIDGKYQECGNDYCDSWSSNYCSGGHAYQKRTCYKKGCASNSCYKNAYVETKLVDFCSANETCSSVTSQCVYNYVPVVPQIKEILISQYCGNGVIIEVLGKKEITDIEWKQEFEADPGDMLDFLIIISNSTEEDIDDLIVKIDLPSEIDYNRDLNSEGEFYSGRINKGINIGSVSADSIKTITFKAKVDPEEIAEFDGDELSVDVTVEKDDYSGSDSVIVYFDDVPKSTASVGFNLWSVLKSWYLLFLTILIITLSFFIFRKLAS